MPTQRPKHNQQPAASAAPETPASESEDLKPVESFEHIDREGILDYVGGQVGRLEAASSARYGDSSAWSRHDADFYGAQEYVSLIDTMRTKDGEPTEDEKFAVQYMDSIIVKNEARAAVYDRKVELQNKLVGNVPEAFEQQFIDNASYAQRINESIEADVAAGVNEDKTPASEENIRGMKQVIRTNKGIINDALVATDEMVTPSGRDVAGLYFREVVARVNGISHMPEDMFTETRADLYQSMRNNLRSARAFTRLTSENKLLDPNSPYAPDELTLSIESIAAKSAEAKKYAFAHKSKEGLVANQENEDEAADEEADDRDLTQQLAEETARIAEQTRQLQAQSQAQGSIPKPSHPSQRGQGTQQQTYSQQPPANSAGTTSTQPIPGGTAGASQSGTGSPSGAPHPHAGNNGGAGGNGGNQPPAGGNGGNGGNTPPANSGTGNGGNTPPPGGNAGPNGIPGSPNAPSSRALKAQRNLVKNAQARLAESGTRRSRLNFKNTDDEDMYLHGELEDQSYRLMELEDHDLIDNPDNMDNQQWGSEIAAYATAAYTTTHAKSTEHLFTPEVKETKNQKLRKVAARAGILAVAGVIGGPAGSALAAGIMTGLKVGKKYEKNGREHLKDAIKEHQAEAAVLEYVRSLPAGARLDPKAAFKAASESLSGQFEKQYVQKRRGRIMGAIAVGAATGFVTQVGVGQLLASIPWAGDNIFQWASKMSWEDTPASWSGGLNPHFNYTMHDRPFSVSSILNGFDFTNKSFF